MVYKPEIGDLVEIVSREHRKSLYEIGDRAVISKVRPKRDSKLDQLVEITFEKPRDSSLKKKRVFLRRVKLISRTKKETTMVHRMKHYEITNDYLGLKKGEVVEAVDVTSRVITVIKDSHKIAIPKVFVEPAKGVKDLGATPVSPIGTSMSDVEARELAKAMGFDGGTPDTAEAVKATEPVEPPKPKKKLKKGQVYLSTITGGRIPSSGIDHVITEVPDKTFNKDQQADIPSIDNDYVWNADLLESMWMSHLLNKRMLLTGFPATGKTTAVQQFCAWIKQPLMRFNGKDGIEASSFLGYVWATKDGMEWKDGMLPQGVRDGYVVLIDEVFKIPSGIQMAMQGLYEENGTLTLDDKPGTARDKIVIPHSMFRMYLTDNVKGTGDNFDKFSATQVQDSSTLDRFGITKHVEYLSKEDEKNMLMKKYPKVDKEIISQLVTFANLIRAGYAKSELSLTLSPRGLQTACELLEHIPNVKQCIQMVYMDKIGEQDEIDAANEIFKTVYREGEISCYLSSLSAKDV
jgi:cobaltochelatase CobS